MQIKKLCVLSRIKQILKLEPGKASNNGFSNSQFNYVSIIPMFRKNNKYLKIQKTHHKVLRLFSIVMRAMMNFFKYKLKFPFTRHIFVY